MKEAILFTDEQKKQIVSAIYHAEKNTYAELKVHIEDTCKGNVLDRATHHFYELGLEKTRYKTGIIIYVAIEDHKLAILGDVGIHQKVGQAFWDTIVNNTIAFFKEKQYCEGLLFAIEAIGNKAHEIFPISSNEINLNELSNDISMSKHE